MENKIIEYLKEREQIDTDDNLKMSKLNKKYAEEYVSVVDVIGMVDEYIDEILLIVESTQEQNERRLMDIVSNLPQEQKEAIEETFTTSDDELMNGISNDDQIHKTEEEK